MFGTRLSLGSLVRVFWRPVLVTWGLTILETATLAALPLLIGHSIDGLLSGDWTPFVWLMATMGALLVLATGRRIYDTRAYGTMRVAFGAAIVDRAAGKPVSAVNARLNTGRELVDFLETDVPLVMAAVIQLIASIVVLFSFHGYLAASAGGATLAVLLIYGLSSGRFFKLNRALNRQTEKQVTALASGAPSKLRGHLSVLRRHEVRISDTEALVYGLVFALLLTMLGFNLWFAAAESGASPGQIFSIVAYSYEFMESAVILPATLQSLTRIAEITARINGPLQLR
ncbi:MAG: ABC transporter six-transmembrane domain-containing protein [Pseudomonadota bacterium]